MKLQVKQLVLVKRQHNQFLVGITVINSVRCLTGTLLLRITPFVLIS